MSPGPLVDAADLPEWLTGLVKATAGLDAAAFTRISPPSSGTPRRASVLMLFGEDEGAEGPDVLLLRRADTLNSHPGQVAFPGGSADAGDDGPVATALREAAEEAGVLPEGVRPVALFPDLYVPVSGFLVTPVLAHWVRPSRVYPVDAAETSAVARVPVAHLVDPANRFRVTHPSGYTGPAFSAPGMLVWGFTAGLLSGLLSLAGWEQPWNAADVRDLDEALRAANSEVPR
ncbi:NUDIX hydrolase [Kutzneria albida]|uniref:NUDIX hydrolase n=1 Tax=Kutzneria albida DSM 43870 TaxID=1449976 RepID=W5VZ18_9PSEU|nr:CoA pyrophosphatase [Kutzneria albida]AHH93685.1 NUDIX hydrolase [Kutzneria albida DSM 43870]